MAQPSEVYSKLIRQGITAELQQIKEVSLFYIRSRYISYTRRFYLRTYIHIYTNVDTPQSHATSVYYMKILLLENRKYIN